MTRPITHEQSLQGYLRAAQQHGQPLSAVAALRIIKSLLGDVQLLHQSGLVHGHITPAAITHQRLRGWTLPAQPEGGLTNQPAQPADDVWGLGQLLYQMLALGRRDVLATLPEALQHIVLKATADNPRWRFAQAGDFLHAIHTYERDAQQRRMGNIVRRGAGLFASVCCICVGLLVLGAVQSGRGPVFTALNQLFPNLLSALGIPANPDSDITIQPTPGLNGPNELGAAGNLTGVDSSGDGRVPLDEGVGYPGGSSALRGDERNSGVISRTHLPTDTNSVFAHDVSYTPSSPTNGNATSDEWGGSAFGELTDQQTTTNYDPCAQPATEPIQFWIDSPGRIRARPVGDKPTEIVMRYNETQNRVAMLNWVVPPGYTVRIAGIDNIDSEAMLQAVEAEASQEFQMIAEGCGKRVEKYARMYVIEETDKRESEGAFSNWGHDDPDCGSPDLDFPAIDTRRGGVRIPWGGEATFQVRPNLKNYYVSLGGMGSFQGGYQKRVGHELTWACGGRGDYDSDYCPADTTWQTVIRPADTSERDFTIVCYREHKGPGLAIRMR